MDDHVVDRSSRKTTSDLSADQRSWTATGRRESTSLMDRRGYLDWLPEKAVCKSSFCAPACRSSTSSASYVLKSLKNADCRSATVLFSFLLAFLARLAVQKAGFRIKDSGFGVVLLCPSCPLWFKIVFAWRLDFISILVFLYVLRVLGGERFYVFYINAANPSGAADLSSRFFISHAFSGSTLSKYCASPATSAAIATPSR